MPNSLSNWFRRKYRSWGKRRNKDILVIPPLPSLPAVRPSVLTPSSSTITLIRTAPPTSTAVATSFFDVLPFEIRRKILIEAFGKQVVHMHLARFQPASDPSKMYTDPAYFPHANRRPRAIRFESKSYISEQNEWRWASSVCHRTSPASMQHEYHDKLYDCACHKGDAWGKDPEDWCDFWPGEKPRNCFIGIMGWLSSSRQAYIEGVDVLYSTNTIHMASNPMILHLPQLLLPQRLGTILSVEMRWHIAPYVLKSGFEEFQKLIAATLANLANVKKLHISIEGNVLLPFGHYPSNDTVNNVFLAPIEAMIRGMSNLQHFQIALPLSLYDEKQVAIKNKYVKSGYAFKHNRIWRSLPGSSFNSSRIEGYWITLGQMDRTLMGGPPTRTFGPRPYSPSSSGSMIDIV